MRLPLVLLLVAARVAAAEPDTRSPDLALGLSLGGAAASVGVFVAGIADDNPGVILLGFAGELAAPTLGEWYAGKYLTWGLGVRGAGAIVSLVGFGSYACGALLSAPCKPGERSEGEVILGVGLATVATGIVMDVVAAPAAADRYNRAHGIAVTPILLTPPSGPVYGAGISGRF